MSDSKALWGGKGIIMKKFPIAVVAWAILCVVLIIFTYRYIASSARSLAPAYIGGTAACACGVFSFACLIRFAENSVRVKSGKEPIGSKIDVPAALKSCGFATVVEAQAGNMEIAADFENKLWSCIILPAKMPFEPKIYHFDEIARFDYFEDGTTVTQGGLGAAAAGGVLFGSVGAIVGSNIGEKTSVQQVARMELRITLTTAPDAIMVFNLNTTGAPLRVGELLYNDVKSKVNAVLSLLERMTARQPENAKPSAADEIAKYKSLLDSGAITEQEYAAKKQQLLNL